MVQWFESHQKANCSTTSKDVFYVSDDSNIEVLGEAQNPTDVGEEGELGGA